MTLAIRLISDVGELSASGFSSGDIPEWNGAQFVPVAAVTDIADLTALGFSDGQVPVWDGSSFSAGDGAPASLKVYMSMTFR